MQFADRLAAAVQKTKSVTCVGLDPRKAQLPSPIRDSVANDSADAWAAAYTQFCNEIVDVVADRVPCVKPQAAFFEQLGPAGMVALGEVIRYATDAGLLPSADPEGRAFQKLLVRLVYRLRILNAEVRLHALGCLDGIARYQNV